MTSSDVLGYDQSPTLSLYYKLDIFKLFTTAIVPLSPTHCLKNILKCHSNGYSLRWRYLLTVFRFQARYVKDSLKYRGAVLWNTICYYEQEVGRSSLNNLKKKINTYSPETTLRNSNLTYFPLAYTYRLFCYLEVITTCPTKPRFQGPLFPSLDNEVE